MDSSKSIAEVHDEAVALHARIGQRHQSTPLNVNQKAKWDELELLSRQSQEYDSAWRVQGIQGLSDALRNLALTEKQKRGSGSAPPVWTEILRDTLDRNPRTKLYLAAMHPSLVEALIRGDITKRLYESDSQFEAVLHQYAELDDLPGTYINVLCRRKHMLGGRTGPDGSSKSQWPGYSMSVPELKVVLQECGATVGDDGAKRGATTKRRFVDKPRSVQIITEWIDAKNFAQLPPKLFDQNFQTLAGLNIFDLSWDVDRQKRQAFSAAIDAAVALPKLKQNVEALEAEVQAKAKDMMTKVSGLVVADRARRNVLGSIQKWRNSRPAVPRQEVLRQNDKGNTASFVSDEGEVSYMDLTASTTPASCGRRRSNAEDEEDDDDDEGAQPRKRARAKDSSPEL
ncbi:hypothetical protein EPUS_09106 [Endocarpon pusillum Z07020]|uniref:Uncharacterized protein n=1 Tax=Endocarpon pusillum (strain Z07020 / HMAS-L-300199) TaxID=1263415 RepID=U1GDW4_ENDPU|nr:uncharacterized protein EPUS_09106 [Endocarpon pusillum Z07020]ERF70268.1 hypothetical protein EPUS_09106 [Endocarpon pusillum Z07020]